MGYQHLEIETEGHVATLWLNRPEKLNAMSKDMWTDLPLAVGDLTEDGSIRVIVIAGRGKAFSVGIDVDLLVGLRPDGPSSAVNNMTIYQAAKRLQRTVNSLADTPKPVIAAIHGYCLGAGTDLISACDIRLAAADAVFSIRETKMGLVADLGALQRLPGILGRGTTAEMAMTGGDYDAVWAKERGLVSEVYPEPNSLMDAAHQMANSIAVNSPLVTQGIKQVLEAGDGRSITDALDYVAQWNASYLISNDLTEALTAFIEKRDPDYTGT